MTDKERSSEEVTFETLRSRVKSAQDKFGNFNSPHEVLGVLAEEMYELTQDVHKNNPIRYELIDVATAAVRAAIQIEEETRNGNRRINN